MQRRRLSALAVVIGLAVAPLAGATVLMALDVEEMTTIAPVVIVGDVNQIEAKWNPARTKIYTRVQITPVEVLKGPADLGTVTIKTIGGKVGDTIASLPGAPRFRTAERVLVFLEPRKDGDGYLTVGFYQGKFEVYKDPQTGVELVQRDGPELGVRIVGPGAARYAEGPRTLDSIRRVVRRQGGAK